MLAACKSTSGAIPGDRTQRCREGAHADLDEECSAGWNALCKVGCTSTLCSKLIGRTCHDGVNNLKKRAGKRQSKKKSIPKPVLQVPPPPPLPKEGTMQTAALDIQCSLHALFKTKWIVCCCQPAIVALYVLCSLTTTVHMLPMMQQRILYANSRTSALNP